ncbi:hypothetical protein DFJ73DRAFT_167556 [Zopfochytrium polystomum]|nr:hypothetical protein DFJ73DRAFT_167556 [Zopfochytrium polystomum]
MTGPWQKKRFRTQAEEAPKRTTRSTKAKATAATNPPSNSHAEKQTPATMVEIETAEPGDQPNDDIIDEGPKPKGRTRKPPAQKSTTTVKRLRTRKAQPELEKPVEDPAPPLIADPVEPPPLVQTNADLVPNPARDVPLMADRFAVSSSPNDEAKIAKIDLKKVDASISRQNQNAPHEPKELPASSLTDATSHSLPAAPVKRSENEPAPKGVQFTEPEPAPALRPREQARTKAASAFPTAIDPSATPQAMPYTQLPGFEDDVGRVVSQWKPHDEPALDFGAMLSEMLAGPDSAADVLSQKLGLFRLEHLTAEERKMSVGDYLREVVQRQRARLLREKERMRAALVAESDRLKRRIEAL